MRRQEESRKIVYRTLKRAFDLLFSSVLLVVLSPLLLLIAVLIRLDSEGPVLCQGARVGQGGEPLHMYKFRTMVVNADRVGGSSTPACIAITSTAWSTWPTCSSKEASALRFWAYAG